MTLDKLKELLAASAAGPWKTVVRDKRFSRVESELEDVIVCDYATTFDAAFIAAIRNAAPALIAVAEAVSRLQGGRWIASHDMVLSLVIDGDERDQLWDAMHQLESALASEAPRE